MVAYISELCSQVYADLFPQLWGRLRAKIQGWGCFHPLCLFSVYSSCVMRQAAEIPSASPKTVFVWKKKISLPNEARNGMIRVVAIGTCLRAGLPDTRGDLGTPPPFLRAVKVCCEEFKPTADRLRYRLRVLWEQSLDRLGFAAKSCEPRVSEHRRI